VQPQPQTESEQPQKSASEQTESSTETSSSAPERVEAPDLQADALQAEPSTDPATSPASSSESNQSASSGDESGVGVERENIGSIGETSSSSSAPSGGALPTPTSESSSGGGGGVGIDVEEGGGGGPGGTGDEGLAGGETVSAGSEEGPSTGSGKKLTVTKAKEEDYTSLEVQKLIQWMKAHPAGLPPGVEQLVGYQPSYLSSKIASLQTSDGEYEMYLMCKQSLREVHVVLVQGGRARYMVDRSFQKQSRKFRVGPVRRSDDTIVGVQTEARARGGEAEQFYSVFLSWWEKAKQDV
jgi:hypothetical protein